mmetsp:Transcript_14387/g.14495  ORF Transcript_14387/g.14495 Transcript_14387/m.14495 type:complete len:98 (-) Transcript_14387:101-394(-)
MLLLDMAANIPQSVFQRSKYRLKAMFSDKPKWRNHRRRMRRKIEKRRSQAEVVLSATKNAVPPPGRQVSKQWEPSIKRSLPLVIRRFPMAKKEGNKD